MSSFLSLVLRPAGISFIWKNVRLFSVTDLPTLLVAMAQYHLYCVYRFNLDLLSYFVTCSLQVLFDLLQVLFDYLNLNKRQTRRLVFCPPL